MKSVCLIFFFFFSFFFYACGPDKPRDIVANKFYSDYVKIYSEYGQVPLDSSEIAIKNFILNFPNDAKAWAFLGSVYLERNEINKAKSAFNNSLVCDSKFANSFSQLGYIYLREKQDDSARFFLERGISLGDSSNANFLNMAFVCMGSVDTFCMNSNANKVFYSKDSISNLELASLVILYSRGYNREKQSKAILLLKERRFDRLNQLNDVLRGKLEMDSFLNKKIL